MNDQMNAPKTIIVFPNLNVAVFDADGQQIPELQKCLATLLAEQIVAAGHDPQGLIIETPQLNWRLFRTEDGGWNREIV